MISATIDLSKLDRALANTAAALDPHTLAPALDADVADFFSGQPIPVQTGRLRHALTQANRAAPRGRDNAGRFTPGGITQRADRHVLVLGQEVRVEIRVPYARWQLRRIPPYSPQRLVPRIRELVAAALGVPQGTL